MNTPPNKSKRLVLMLSGGIDALIGAFLLLLGFELLPITIAQNWLAILLGAAMFIVGAGTFAYNFSRLEE